MPVVEKDSGGRVYLRPLDRTFEIGDRADVDEEMAAYLCEERGDFCLADEADGDDNEGDGVDEANDENVWNRTKAAVDPEAFLDRTPMSEVVEDIAGGDVDGILGEVEDAAERKGVLEAIEQRYDELED
jgi:hypothetical protein